MGDPEGMEIHHINGDTLDARRSNLAAMDRTDHIWTRGPHSDATGSRYKGVTLSKRNKYKKWIAAAYIGKKTVFFGSFETEEDAARAYDRGIYERIGPDAYFNFPDELPSAEEAA